MNLRIELLLKEGKKGGGITCFGKTRDRAVQKHLEAQQSSHGRSESLKLTFIESM